MGKGPSRAAVGIAAALAAVFLLTRSGDAEAASAVGPGEDPNYPPPPDPIVTGDEMANSERQVSAFLTMIRAAEHSIAAVNAGTDYGTFYGGARFTNFADHPVLTGELRGVPLTDAQCRNAGYGPGCVSTAAGAYQLTRPTWEAVREAGAWGPRLDDFTPASQDEAARRVLMLSGAWAPLLAGDIRGAILKAGKRWASLPGSTAKQNPKSLDVVLAYFANAGGIA